MSRLDSELTTPSPHLLDPRNPREKQMRSRSKRKTHESDSITRKTILIVEDEALVAENLREFIEQAGYRVTAVLSTGEEAIQSITRNPADLILMDVRLGGQLTGIETIDLIHHSIKQIPVVFMSAFAEDLFPAIATMDASLYRYVAKPYMEEELETIIREFLA